MESPHRAAHIVIRYSSPNPRYQRIGRRCRSHARRRQDEASAHQGRIAKVVRATSIPHSLVLAVVSFLDDSYEAATRLKLHLNVTLSHPPYSLVSRFKSHDHDLVFRRKVSRPNVAARAHAAAESRYLPGGGGGGALNTISGWQ